jgi:hypothetical protein
MEPNLTPVLDDVFAVADTLTVSARLRLTALLALPGHAQAILPRQLASAPLPADARAREAVRAAIEAGLAQQALATLAPCRLDAVVPALAHCDPGAPARRAPTRLRGQLAKHLSGPPISEFTIGEISSWSGFGPRRVALLVGAAVGAAMDVVGSGCPIPVGPESQTTAADDVHECLSFLDDALAAGGDDRDRGVFENAVLPLGPSVTRPELALALGIGPEQVRRLGARAAQRVDAVLGVAQTAVRELAASVSDRLGVAAPRAAVDELVASFGLPGLPDSRSRLLLWMAGPYRELDGHPDWVALDRSGLVAETRRLINEDGGVRPVEHVVRELHTVGMAAEHVQDWLSRQSVRISDGLVVATTGSPGDVAERALHAQGRPMSVDEIAGWVPGGKGGTETLWSARDRRFLVTDGDALALVEWGEYPAAASA